MSARGAAGFTLVELLVVLAIFGLMAGLLSGGFHSLAGMVGGGTRRLDRSAELALTDNLLERVVADARPLPAGDGIAFEGTAEAMRFVGAAPARLAQGGFHAEALAVEERRGRRQLVFRAVPLGREQGSRSVLFDDVAAVRFAYFGRLAAAEPAAWHAQWTGRAGLPALVRLSISFPDGSAAPDLVVALRPAEAEFR